MIKYLSITSEGIIMKKVQKEFDMNRKVIKPRFYLMPVEWVMALYYRIAGKTKYKKTNFKSYKEPALILVNHGSMFDFANVVVSMFPRRVCWVCSIEEFIGKEWLFRHIGVFPKRKFTNDLIVVKRTAELIRNQKMSVCIFPEARFSIGGVKEHLSPALGKMAKLCKCRVIVIKQRGNYLKSPQWDKHPYRDNKIYVEATEVISKEDSLNLDADVLQQRIEDAFVYDEYKSQIEDNNIIKNKERAENIHRILYKCPVCGDEYHMNSKGINLWCEKCNSKWEMDELSRLHQLDGESRFELVSDWYRWEREEAYKEVNEGTYHFEDDCRIEKLVNAKVGFEKIGDIHMIHDINGYHLYGKLDDGSDFDLTKAPQSTSSMHIEYDFKGRGDALDIATLDSTWWVFPKHRCPLTKFNFTTEAIFEKIQKK